VDGRGAALVNRFALRSMLAPKRWRSVG
jgi:hypothetical protein